MSHLFLDESRIHTLLESAKGNLRDYALLHLAASTAMRGSDLLKLKLKDAIDSDGAIVRVLRTKMKKTSQWIERPLRDDCRTALMAWIDSRSDKNPYLFIPLNPNYVKRNKPWHRWSYHKMIHFYLEKLYHKSVLQGCATHTLRRSVAKLVHRKTGDISVAQILLGHSSPVNTSKYIDSDEIKERSDKVVLEELQW